MRPISQLRISMVAFVGLAAAWIGGVVGTAPGADQEKDALAAGKELFAREWLHGDKRSFAGDGLGPVFIARSCVACHHQGGAGGAGAKQTNATLVSVFVAKELPMHINGTLLDADPKEVKSMRQPDRAKLTEIHPVLRTESSFPLHRFSSDRELLRWKSQFVSEFSGGNENGESTELAGHASLIVNQNFTSSFRDGESRKKIDGVSLALIPSQRNTPALFGIGLIERIPESVLDAVAFEQAKAASARSQDESSPKTETFRRRRGIFGMLTEGQGPLPITGRVMHLKDGRVGRFGWKANVATLKEFTLQACSNELGLEVPGFPRAVPGWKKDYKAPGLDLSAAQCDQLIRYVASLPKPVQRPAETPQHAEGISAGQKLFSSVGCATCHRPKLGDVEGIYSDLLLHDMGQLLSDSGSYSTNVTVAAAEGAQDPLPVKTQIEAKDTKEQPPKFGASTREWRTPPLWGLRDSAQYLHDGRADTIADAVALHGGEGLIAAEAFFKLAPRERQQVELFLQSLAAPDVR